MWSSNIEIIVTSAIVVTTFSVMLVALLLGIARDRRKVKPTVGVRKLKRAIASSSAAKSI